MATFIQIEKGPDFEVYQGQDPDCVQRLDWRQGAIRSIYVGHVGVESADIFIRHFERQARVSGKERGKERITVLHDVWDSTGYEGPFRMKLSEWARKNASSVAMFHTLSRSKIWDMAFSVNSLACPGMIMIHHSKRPDFGVLVAKLGFPLNPPMPQGLAAARP